MEHFELVSTNIRRCMEAIISNKTFSDGTFASSNIGGVQVFGCLGGVLLQYVRAIIFDDIQFINHVVDVLPGSRTLLQSIRR
jgi:hypothetical protein